MLKDYRENDIILNFYRSRAYRLNMDNIDQLKDLSRCRLANFQEIQLFEQLEKTQKIIYLKDLGIGQKWSKEYTIKISVSDSLMRKLIDISKDKNITDYQQIINYYLQQPEPTDRKEKAYKEKYENIKTELKKLRQIINGIKL